MRGCMNLGRCRELTQRSPLPMRILLRRASASTTTPRGGRCGRVRSVARRACVARRRREMSVVTSRSERGLAKGHAYSCRSQRRCRRCGSRRERCAGCESTGARRRGGGRSACGGSGSRRRTPCRDQPRDNAQRHPRTSRTSGSRRSASQHVQRERRDSLSNALRSLPSTDARIGCGRWDRLHGTARAASPIPCAPERCGVRSALDSYVWR